MVGHSGVKELFIKTTVSGVSVIRLYGKNLHLLLGDRSCNSYTPS